MRIAVAFGEESLDFEVPEDRLVGSWVGPTGGPAEDAAGKVRRALAEPREFPPLGRAVVPGDRVVLAIDPEVPEPGVILAALSEELVAAGVEPADVLILEPGPAPSLPAEAIPPGMRRATHDPAAREQLAYLATSAAERRVYLNRELTDADVVVPVGLLGVDPALGYRGPWGVIYPGLADEDAQRAYRGGATGAGAALLEESAEVGWLLGSHFHVGVVPGTSGLLDVVAGQDAAVRAGGIAAVEAAWSFRAEERADLVIAGVGGPGRPATLDDLGIALEAATKVVRRGGKIVALSRVRGPIGPALQRLVGADDARSGPAALRGAEGEPDYPTARRIAEALAWADVYLFSELPEGEADDLAFIPLGRPEEARRLVAASPSSLFLSQADRTRTHVADEPE